MEDSESLSEAQEREVLKANVIDFQASPLVPSSLETFLSSTVFPLSLFGEMSQGRDGLSDSSVSLRQRRGQAGDLGGFYVACASVCGQLTGLSAGG